MKVTRAASIPLVTHDPYFSIWSSSDHLYDAYTVHWNGKSNKILGNLKMVKTIYYFILYFSILYYSLIQLSILHHSLLQHSLLQQSLLQQLLLHLMLHLLHRLQQRGSHQLTQLLLTHRLTAQAATQYRQVMLLWQQLSSQLLFLQQVLFTSQERDSISN